MKYFFIIIVAFFCLDVSAQIQAVKREAVIKAFEKDSINIAFTENYLITDDSCAAITRLGHYNFQERKFKGRFIDVNRLNLQQIIAAGTYDENGLKDGDFISYYLNGKIQAKGNFKHNMFDGKWDFFYPDGTPKITFVADGNNIKIVNTWNEDGKKIIDNGYGNYESIIGGVLVWKGKLVGGTPDGKWTLQRTIRSEDVLVTERFKLGEFQKGSNQAGEYKDSSHIVLVSMDILPLINAENLWVSNEPCNATRKKFIINARYPKGADQFGEEIKDRLAPVLEKMNLSFNEPLELQGKILEDGRIIFDAPKGDSKNTSPLISALHSLPLLEPARADGKPTQQDMIIIIKLNSSVYSFSYRFLPVNPD